MNYESLLFVLTICLILMCITLLYGSKTGFYIVLTSMSVYTIIWMLCALLIVYFA